LSELKKMTNGLAIIILLGSFLIIYSPIWWQRRRIARMASEDLKNLDHEEWRRQAKSEVYIKMFSRIVWGLFILSGFIFNFQKIVAPGFNWAGVFAAVLGILFIVWGVLGFRRQIKQIENLK